LHKNCIKCMSGDKSMRFVRDAPPHPEAAVRAKAKGYETKIINV
jgi:hypothetical protein